MNKERVLAVADAIEQSTIPDLGFNMLAILNLKAQSYPPEIYTVNRHSKPHPCGTVGCIAGWAYLLATGLDPHKAVEKAEEESVEIMDEAKTWLGLTRGQAEDLFQMANTYLQLEEATSDMAVTTLRHFAETGEIVWRKP